MQLAELREYAGCRAWQVFEKFTDLGISGCKESRPALNRLKSDASRRRFDAVLVRKIDSFGRSLKHLVNWPNSQPLEWPSIHSMTEGK